MRPVEGKPLWVWLTQVCSGAAVPVLVERGVEGETVLAAASLHTRALETWHAWRRQGARPGHVVEDPCPSGIEAVVRLLACLAGGLVWRPLKANAQPLGGAWRFNTTSGHLDGGPTGPGRGPLTSGVLLESSGTEGQPKSVLLTQAALVWQLEAHQRALALAPHDVRVLTLPWSHAFGLVLDLLLGLVSQQTLVVAPLSTSWSPRSLALLLKEVEATWWCTVPRVLELMVGAAPSPGGPLRVLVGGAPVGPSLRETAREWLGAGGRLHVGYGLTEAGPGVSLDGRLLPGVSARLEDGRLFVQSPAWCGPESESGWHDTGDLATLDADGQLEVLGRTGRRVKGPDATWQSLDLLEQELARRPGLRAATIDRREQGWSVAVLLDDGAGPPAGLERFLERRIGGPIALRWERATPRLLAALAAIPAKSLSVALARVLGDPQLHDWAPAWA